MRGRSRTVVQCVSSSDQANSRECLPHSLTTSPARVGDREALASQLLQHFATFKGAWVHLGQIGQHVQALTPYIIRTSLQAGPPAIRALYNYVKGQVLMQGSLTTTAITSRTAKHVNFEQGTAPPGSLHEDI